MRCKVVTVVRQKGTGKVSGKPFDFQTVGALIETARGTEFCEFNINGDVPAPESGKVYEVQLSFYPDKFKKLALQVVELKAVVPAAVAVK